MLMDETAQHCGGRIFLIDGLFQFTTLRMWMQFKLHQTRTVINSKINQNRRTSLRRSSLRFIK